MIQSTMPANRKCFHDRDKNLKIKKNKNVQRKKKKLQKLKHLADLYNECVKMTEIHVPYRTHFTQTPEFLFLLFFLKCFWPFTQWRYLFAASAGDEGEARHPVPHGRELQNYTSQL